MEFPFSAKTNRRLEAPLWLVAHDFFTIPHNCQSYQDTVGVMSNKMGLCKLFKWHPAHNSCSHRLLVYGLFEFLDDLQDWFSMFIFRKQALANV